MQIDYKEYIRTGDIEKLSAFDVYRWILSIKHSKTNACESMIGTETDCGEQKKAPAFQPLWSETRMSAVSRLWWQLNR